MMRTENEPVYYIGKNYHYQLGKVLLIISKYLMTKLSIPDIHNLENEIVKLQNIYESEES